MLQHISGIWDVTPLGDRFLFNSLPDINLVNVPLTVVLNWQKMLEKSPD